MPGPAPVRTIVTDQKGRIVSDSGPTLPEPVDLEALGEGVAETFDDLATLARQSAKVAGRIQRIGKAVSTFVGPLDRPLPEREGK